MDTSTLGQVAAELMDRIDAKYPDAELGEVMVLAEVKGNDEDGEWTGIHYRCSDDRAWIQHGLLYFALNSTRLTGDDEGDDG